MRVVPKIWGDRPTFFVGTPPPPADRLINIKKYYYHHTKFDKRISSTKCGGKSDEPRQVTA